MYVQHRQSSDFTLGKLQTGAPRWAHICGDDFCGATLLPPGEAHPTFPVPHEHYPLGAIRWGAAGTPTGTRGVPMLLSLVWLVWAMTPRGNFARIIDPYAQE